jgi:anaerobic magnesium-protoporphyrin IX monomethyl ester cyclase
MGVDVLIGQAYFLRFDPTLWKGQQPYAPLGALYAAAYAREAGHSVALFDAMLAESESDWDQRLDSDRPAVAVLFEDSFNYLTKMCLLRMREAATRMVAAAHTRGIRVVVAGSDATDHPDLYLEAGADAVIAGEGEQTLVDVIEATQFGLSLSAIPGLVMREGGSTLRTPPRAIMRDLDALPRPAWDLVDLARYKAIWRQHHGHFSMNVSTTRGCPYHCNWCAKPIYGQRYTARSAASFADEVAWLRRTHAPDHLWITDDIFGLKPGWIEDYAREVVARQAATPFKCLMRADGVTASTVAALRAARCRTVWIGAESGSQRILDAMDKGTTVEQIEAASALLRDAGIDVGLFLQFGYPGETMTDIDATIAMVRRCRPADIGISVSYPLPGTPFYERVRAGLGDKQNWVDSADLAMIYHATYPPEFYRALHPLVHARFRIQRGVHALRELASEPGRLRELAPRLLGGAHALVKLPQCAARVRRLASAAHTRERHLSEPVLPRTAAALPLSHEQSH